jgi:hypothetical protein
MPFQAVDRENLRFAAHRCRESRTRRKVTADV